MNCKDYLLTTTKNGKLADCLIEQFVAPKFRRRFNSLRRRRRFIDMHMF